MPRVNQLWEIKWSRSRQDDDVPEGEWLWVVARNAREAATKAAEFLRRKYRGARVTGVEEHGTIDVF